MLFGDSITQAGWTEGAFGARLAGALPSQGFLYKNDSQFYCADVYSRKFDVLNRGLAGYNTEWAIPVLEQASGINFPADRA